MDERSADAGTIQVLLNRLNRQRLPRLLEIMKRLNRGELMEDTDMRFLQTVQKDAADVMRLADRNPQIQAVVAQVVKLYDDITRKALENERNAAGGGR